MLAIFILILVSHALNGLKIVNVTNQPLIQFQAGQMRIQDGSVKIAHRINLTDIKTTIDALELLIKDRNDTELEKILTYEIENVKYSARRLRPLNIRKKRWDLYGSFIKAISGVPDAHDLRRIDGKLSELGNNSNAQQKINDEIETKINEIRDLIMSGNVDKSNIDLITIIFNVKIIREKLDNILDAIGLANKNIVSRKLIRIDEVELLARILVDQGIQLPTMEQVFDYTTPEIVTNNETITYNIAVPQLKPVTYDIVKLHPVTINNEQLTIKGSFATKFPNVLQITQSCKQIQQLTICEKNQVVDKTSDTCIQDTIFKAQASCEYKKVSRNNKITQVTPTAILIEAANTTLINNCEDKPPIKLLGSFVIDFSNCSITIENDKFVDLTIRNISIPKLITWWKPEILNSKNKLNITRLNLSKLTHISDNKRNEDWTPPLYTALIIILLILVTIKCSR